MSTTLNKILSAIIVISMIATLVLIPASTVLAEDHIKQTNYIIQGKDVNLVAQLVEEAGGDVTARLEIINAVGAYLPEHAIFQLTKNPEITSLHPNTQVFLADEEQTDPDDSEFRNNEIPETNFSDVIGADFVWDEDVFGENVTVAVVDTGLSRLKPLAKNMDGKTDRILAFADFVSNNHLAEDENGHGTHVAAIIANSQHGLDEEWNGVAPGVDLVGVRVLDETGTGSYVKVIQGIQWVIRHKDIYNIKVMNLSIIANAVSPYWADPLNQAVTRAWAEGIVVVTAAGNAGPGSMTIGVPGNNPYVITVGAFTDNYTPMDFNDDYVVPFSSSGPTLDGFVKPDVVAPGAHITSLMKNNAYLIKQEIAQPVGRNYYQLAGTSQATAVVSGLSALILSKHPELTPDQVKLRIMGTSFVWVDPESTEALYSMWQQGAGRINAYDAVFAEIEGLANEGMDIWADLAGDIHYEGYSYYDETDAVYKLRGDFGTWSGGYGVWSGDYGVWSGGYGVWSGDYGVWSGDYGVWSGDYGVWSGGYGVWSGDYGVWSGGYGVWSGGYGVWSGGYGVWSGTEPWAETDLATYEFVNNYLEAIPPEPGSAAALIGIVESNK